MNELAIDQIELVSGGTTVVNTYPVLPTTPTLPTYPPISDIPPCTPQPQFPFFPIWG